MPQDSSNFLILIVFFLIDDLYLQYAPASVSHRRYVKDAKLSDSEIITISICGELIGIDSENAWFSFVKKNYKYLFPKIGSKSRFNRTRRALLQTTELLCEIGRFHNHFEITLASTDDREGLRDMTDGLSNIRSFHN